jgi:hypothetical protein
MAAPATSVKLFNKWSFEDVTVADLSLKDYIAIDKQVGFIAAQQYFINTSIASIRPPTPPIP